MSDDDELDLFREAVGPVRRVRSRRDQSRPAPRKPGAHMRAADEERVLRELESADIAPEGLETGEELLWLRPGMQRRLLTRLRRGHWSVQDEIDLHAMNVVGATRSIRYLLDEAEARHRRCVKIIHGKGLRSGPGGPRLKAVTARVLSRHPRVLAFASAPPADGGTGAVYVLLKAGR